MNAKKTFLSVGGTEMTADDVAELVGISDSDNSDWDEIEEMKVNDFLTESPKKKIVKVIPKTVKEISKTTAKVEILNRNQQNPNIINNTVKQTVNKVNDTKNRSVSVNQKLSYFLATPTNVRVMNPRLSIEVWRERITGRQVIPSSNLCIGNTVERLIDTDWIMIGVIVQRSGTKKTKADKNYSSWMLNDLQCLEKAVRFMLFGDVHDTLWKEGDGTVVAILRPKLMPSNKGYSEKSFTVDLAAQVIVLGQSPDYGTCEGRKKGGEMCTNVINKAVCGLCTYHIQQGYSKAVNRPGFGDIRQETLESRKRAAPNQEWKMLSKKPKSDGIIVNNAIGSLSMAKLHKSGITESATKWGLLDVNAVAKMSESMNKENQVTLTEKEEKFAALLKKAGAGSMNLVKCITENSGRGSVLADKVIRRNKVFDNSRPTVAKDVTFQGIMERLKGPEIVRDDPQKYIDLDLKPVQLSKVSSEVYKAELNKLRASALAKAKGGYAQLRASNMAEHLRTVGTTTKTAEVKEKAPLSEEMLRLLRQGSSHSDLVDINKDLEREKKMDHLEKVEKIELKMSSIQEQSCHVFYCHQCKNKSLKRPLMCAAEGHQVERVKGHKRWFACLKCKHRLMTLEKYPDEACYKCGAAVYEKTGMSSEKLAVVMEKPLVDGGEKRFINN